MTELRRMNLAQRILLTTLVAAPLVFGFRITWDLFNLPKLVVISVGIGLAAFALVGLPGRSLRGAARHYWVPAIAILAPLVVGWLASPYKGFGLMGRYSFFQGVIPYALLIAFGWFAVAAFADDARPLLKALAVSGTAAGIFSVTESAGLGIVDWDLYGTVLPGSSTLGNPNFAGSFFALCFPACLALADQGRRVWLIPVVVVTVGLLLADTETAWGGALAGGAMYWAVSRPHESRWPRRIGGLVFFLCAAIGVGLVVLASTFPSIGDRAPSLEARGSWWIAAGGQIIDSPLVGKGPDSFGIEAISYRPVADALQYGFEFSFDPHNVLLNLGASAGLLGVAGFVILLLWTLRRIAEATPDKVHAGFAGIATAYFVQSLASTDQVSVRLLFWTAVGGLAAPRVQELVRREHTDERRLGDRLRLLALPVAGLLSIGTGSALLYADHQAWLGVQSGQRDEFSAATPHFEKAWRATGEIVYRKLAARAYAYAVRFDEDERPVQENLEGFREAYAYVDEVPFVNDIVGFADLLRGLEEADPAALEDALQLYDKAFEIDEVNPLIRSGMASALIASGRPQQAQDLLYPLFIMAPPQAEYWGTLALASALVEDDSAEFFIEEALRRDPEDPHALAAQDFLNGQGKGV